MNRSSPTFIAQFFKQESAAGILLMIAAALAIGLANSPLQIYYDLLIDTPVAVKIGEFSIDKPLLLWINDGLMAIFFLMVGLELKREVLDGELSDFRNVVLPMLGAVGGMVVPAAFYIVINRENEFAMQGWAIPAATDIAFALGVLALLGSRVPISLKIFLTSLAIFDDIGAIIIIAVFYASKISLLALAVASSCLFVLFIMNRSGVIGRSAYLIVGAVMWTALLKSGVHATLAGVVLAMFIPLRVEKHPNESPLKILEHDLHPTVAYLILPVFAFANSGISFAGLGIDSFLHPVPMGIAAGLFFGKQIGVFVFCWLGIKMRIASLPRNMNWLSLYGTALLCGIGFTMSLFISALAFEETGVNQFFDERLGILFGSLASGIVGYFVLRQSLKTPKS